MSRLAQPAWMSGLNPVDPAEPARDEGRVVVSASQAIDLGAEDGVELVPGFEAAAEAPRRS